MMPGTAELTPDTFMASPDAALNPDTFTDAARPSAALPDPETVDQLTTFHARQIAEIATRPPSYTPPVPAAPQPQPSESELLGGMSPMRAGFEAALNLDPTGILPGLTHALEGGAKTATGKNMRERAGGLHEAISGAFEAATPAMGEGLAAKPLKTLGSLAVGMASQEGVVRGLKKLGLPEEYANVAGDLAGIIAGVGAHEVGPKAVEAIKTKYGKVLADRAEKAQASSTITGRELNPDNFMQQTAPAAPPPETAKPTPQMWPQKAIPGTAKPAPAPAKPQVPETGIPENVARAIDARENLTRRFYGASKQFTDLTNSERNAVDSLISEGYGFAVQPPEEKPTNASTKKPATPEPAAAEPARPAAAQPVAAVGARAGGEPSRPAEGAPGPEKPAEEGVKPAAPAAVAAITEPAAAEAAQPDAVRTSGTLPESPAAAPFSARMREAKTGNEGREILRERDNYFGSLEKQSGLPPTVGEGGSGFSSRGFSTVTKPELKKAIRAATAKSPEIGAKLKELADDAPEVEKHWKQLLANELAEDDAEFQKHRQDVAAARAAAAPPAAEHAAPAEPPAAKIEEPDNAPAEVQPEREPGGEGQEVPESRRPSHPVAHGEETEVFVEGRDQPYKARYAVRELSDTYASHNAFTFDKNPDFHYINDRDYSLPANRQRVITASGSKFAPSRVINTNADAINGPSVIEPDGNVLGGNNRRMALERVYSLNPKGAAAYRELLIRKAAQFGIDPDAIRAMRQPVLVREIAEAELDPQHAITEFNYSPAGGHSIGERAAADARSLTPAIGKYIATVMEGAGPDATLTDVLNSKRGPEVVNHLIRAGIFTDNERPQLIDAVTENVTSDAKQRIAKMLLGGLFKDSEAFQAAEASLRNKLERVAPLLKQLEGKEGWDLTPEVKQAIEGISFERDYGKAYGMKPGESFLIKAQKSEHQGQREHQAGMFGAAETPEPPAMSDRAKILGDFIRTSNPTAIARAFRAFTEKSTEKSLFGEADPAEAFGEAFGAGPAIFGSERGAVSPQLLSLGVEKLWSDDIAPKINAAARAVTDSADDILKVLAPTLRDENAQTAGFILRGKLAELARKTDQAKAALAQAKRVFNLQTAADNYAFVDRIEKGKKQPAPELQAIAKVLRSMLDDRRKQVQALGKGKLQKFYENYFPHVWADPRRAAQVFSQFFARRPFEGGKAFLKKRTHLTFEDGLAAGLQPVSDNPVDLVLLKIREMDKFLVAHETLAEWKKTKLATFVDAREGKAPRGWMQIADPIGTVYGQSVQQIPEYPNAGEWRGLNETIKSLGLTHKRGFLKLGDAIGRAHKAGGKIETAHGSRLDTLAHEIGHQIDWLAGSGKRFVTEYPDAATVTRLKRAYKTLKDTASTLDDRRGAREELKSLKGAITQRKEFAKQLRDLADLRDGETSYVRSREEKMAQLAQMWVGARPLFERTAPKVFDEWKKFLDENPKLHPLRDTEADANAEALAQPYDVGGLVVSGHYYAPEGAARILNNYLSPGLRERSGIFRSLLGLNNVLNQYQLGMSAFHLGFTSIDTTVSKAALGYQAIARGKPIAAARFFAETPTAAFTTFLKGDKMLREWYKPGSQGAAIGKLVDNLVTAGGRARMDSMYRTQIAERMLSALRAGNIVGAAVRAPFAGVEFVSNLIMDEIVPRMKMGAFADMARFHLENLPADATFEDARKVLVQDWNSVENRLGEMTYDNLFWSRTVKDLAMLTTRSVGWNLGTLREIGGGLVDIVAQPLNALRGKPLNLNRLSYLLGMVTVNAAMSSIYQYLKTGKGPDELEDYIFPKNGELDEHGRAQRVSWPTYMKDVYHYSTQPVKTLEGKVAPIWTSFAEMIHNRDFYGTEIRNPDDPLVAQLRDLAENAAKQFIPLAVRNYEREKQLGATPATKAEQFVGITPAPADLNEGPGEKLAREIAASAASEEPRTRENAARRELRQSLTRSLHAGKGIPADVVAARKAGTLSTKDIQEAFHAARETSLARSFEHLGIEDAIRVYKKADPAERKQLQLMFLKKARTAIKNQPPATRPKVLADVRAAIAR